MGSQLSNCLVESGKPSISVRSSILNPRISLKKSSSLTPKGYNHNFFDVSINITPFKRSRSFNTQFTQGISPNTGFNPNQNDIALKNFTILREFDTDHVYKGKRYLVSKKNNPNMLFTMTNCKKSMIKQQQNDLFVIQKQVFESNNPFLSRLQYLIENKSTLFIFQTYFSGLDLAFQVQKTGCFKEKFARFYLAEMILALENLPNNLALYQSLICYLDMKSMLVDRDGHLNMNIVSPLLRATKKVGSSMDERYNPPEFFLNTTDKSSYSAIFAWKLGVFLYEMLCGEKAFQNSLEIMENNVRFSHVFPVSAVDLIGKLLLVDPQKRLGNNDISELKSHEFFSGVKWKEMLEKRTIGPLALSSKQDSQILDKDHEKFNAPKADFDINAGDEQLDLMEVKIHSSTAEKTNSFLSNVSEEDEEIILDNN